MSVEIARQETLSKTKIDKIGDAFRDGHVDADAIHALEAYRAEFLESYSRVERILRDVLGHPVTGRPAKSTISIIEKLRRQKTRLTQIQDIAGCRVVVGTVTDQDSLVEAARVMFPTVVIDDKRNDPTHGYRAVHLIVKESGRNVEVQVRTQLQHFWAELSEKMADTYGQEIKYGHGHEWARGLLMKTSVQIKKIEDLLRRRLDMIRQARDLKDKKSVRKAKKAINAIDLRIRLDFYELRNLVHGIEV